MIVGPQTLGGDRVDRVCDRVWVCVSLGVTGMRVFQNASFLAVSEPENASRAVGLTQGLLRVPMLCLRLENVRKAIYIYPCIVLTAKDIYVLLECLWAQLS